MRASWVPVVLAVVWTSSTCAEIAVVDRGGKISAMAVGGDYLPVGTDLRIPLKGWGTQPSLDDARDVKYSREGGRATWEGRIEVEPGKNYRFRQTIEEVGEEVRLGLKVAAEAEVEIEGVFLWVDVGIEDFAGGRCALTEGGATVAEGEMPREKPENRHFLRGRADGVTMADAAGQRELAMSFDLALPVVVQDTREWRGTQYSVFAQLAPSLAEGESTALQVVLRASGQADQTPATLSLDASRARYHLDGFGGNYCFNIESPVTQYTLSNLRIGWARTEMTPGEWEPENDNDSPTETDWALVESHDKPGSNLRREFELARQIQGMGVPYVISIWHLPEWLYADPGKGPQAHGRRVAPDKWDELLECLGSYLVYAKRKYGVEPDLFCFNEANIGVRVLFTAEEHRDAIKRIGGHFQSLGLKTKMLLADATGPRGTHTYALPAAADAEAMKYVGAVAFHSWGGGSPADYGAWGDLAERLKLPLLVTELGVDAGAWRTRSFDSFHYALREVRMYQELLLYARPQGTMQWEFTSDYSTVAEEKDAEGKTRLVPTVRFEFVRHFCNLTPRGAEALGVASDNDKVLFTAFAGDVGGKRAYTLHVANLGSGRPATISGVPAGVASLRAVQTSQAEAFQELEAVKVAEGRAELELAPQSLLTLTTMPAD